MTQRFFNCVSVILHPVFLTTIGIILLTIWLLPAVPEKSKLMLIGFSASYTIVIPLCFVALARITGFIESFNLRRRNERIISLIVTAVCLFFFSNMLKTWHAPLQMRAFVIGTVILMLIAAALTFFTRVSMHAIAWGGITALVSHLSFHVPNLSMFLAIVVLLSGLACTARLYLNEHLPRHIYTGFLIGFATIWSTLFILSL